MRKITSLWQNLRFETVTDHSKKWITAGQYRRARRPVGRSGGLMRGKFPSFKNQRMIHWESQLERDAIFLFEYSPAVVSYREQPFTAFYVLDDQTHRYTPDFELTFDNYSKLIVEVKPATKLQRPDIQKKFGAIAQHFSDRHQKFRILTEVEIQQPQLQKNLRLVQKYRCPPPSAFERRLLLEKLSSLPTPSFSAISQLFGCVSEVWTLIGHGIVHTDLRQCINESTLFSLNKKDIGYVHIYF